MKTKLLFAFLSTFLFSNAFAQQVSLDYVSGLSEPSAMVHQGNMLYVQGPENLYQINTATTSPIATVIYTAPSDFYMTNLTISGNIIYIAEENYIESSDTFVGCRIISIDLTNLAAPANVIHTTTKYVSSLVVNGNMVYFSSETDPDGEDNFTVQIHKIAISTANPIPTVVISNLTQNNEVNDMVFYSNNLLISVGGDSKVFGFDTTDAVPVVTNYLSNLSFNKGMFVNGNRLFIAQANFIGTKQLDITDSVTNIAQNTTYQDTNNGQSFNANFRDVVLIGDKLYMTLRNQGRVVYIQDASLAAKEFSLDAVSIYNSKTELTVKGLQNSQNATVYNVSGQQLVAKQISNTANTIDISTFSNGVYFLKLDHQTFKFIK